MWEICKFAHARGLIMDFDGFVSPTAGRFMASFGGTPVPRPVLLRKGIWSSTVTLARRLVWFGRRLNIAQED